MLGASLVELTLKDAGRCLTAGLSGAVARCCPRLEALRLDMGVLHSKTDSQIAAALVEVLESLPGLRSLSLSDVWLSAEVLRALGNMPHLTALTFIGVDSCQEGLEELGGRCGQLRSLSVTDMPEDRLCLLLRGMSAACRLVSLHLAVENRSWSDTSFAAQITPSLAVCTGALREAQTNPGCRAGAPLTELIIDGDVRADTIAWSSAEVEALLDAAAGARSTLKTFSLNGVLPHEPAVDVCKLAAFTRLESLHLDTTFAVTDSLIAHLIATLKDAAPDLHSIHVARPSYRFMPDPLPEVARCMPLTAAELCRVSPYRMRRGGRNAWGIVCAGITAEQEKRVRGAAPRGRSPVEALPHGVLRCIGTFLSWAVRLSLNEHRGESWSSGAHRPV